MLWLLLTELNNWLQHHVVKNFTVSDQAGPFAFPQSIQSKQKRALSPDDKSVRWTYTVNLVTEQSVYFPCPHGPSEMYFCCECSRCELGIMLLRAGSMHCLISNREGLGTSL